MMVTLLPQPDPRQSGVQNFLISTFELSKISQAESYRSGDRTRPLRVHTICSGGGKYGIRVSRLKV